MKALSTAALSRDLEKHLKSVADTGEVIIIPPSDKGEGRGIAIISLDRFIPYDETDYLMSSKANREHLRASIAQDKSGTRIPVDLDEVDGLIRKR